MKTNIHYGLIIKYDVQRKFGFIRDKNTNHELFFHESNLDRPFRIEPEKTVVTFKLGTNEKGPIACSIREDTEIDGAFKDFFVSNKSYYKTNEEKYEFLKRQHEKAAEVLSALKSLLGISYSEENNWINLDYYSVIDFENPNVKDGHLQKEVLSGYPKTFNHFFKMLESEIGLLNRDYVSMIKGREGEKETRLSLQSIASMKCPIIENLNLKTNDFSAEIDLLIITNQALFLIETKSLGGKNCKLNITHSGDWILENLKNNKKTNLRNTFKQIIDHQIVLRNYLKDRNINIPIIPVIAIANNTIELSVDSSISNIIGEIQILRSSLVGPFIFNYLQNHSHPLDHIFTQSEIDNIVSCLESAKKENTPRKFRTIDRLQNISEIVGQLQLLSTYYEEDCAMEKAREAMAKAREEEDSKRAKKLENLAKILGFAEFLVDNLLGF